MNSWQSRPWYTGSSPRTRGALSHDPSGRTMSGSSPRMRGALLPALLHDLADRIIPADAGSNYGRWDLGSVSEDHPRGCREHWPKSRTLMVTCGSSPRMRGAPSRWKVIVLSCRIIPADAGSTWFESSWGSAIRDHPRGCGEHDGILVAGPADPGSSPRMRGAHDSTTLGQAVERIIPADAGSTPWCQSILSPYVDHPRGCGEHGKLYIRAWSNGGSSPRMRGALPLLVRGHMGRGIIPADAGSTRRLHDPAISL